MIANVFVCVSRHFSTFELLSTIAELPSLRITQYCYHFITQHVHSINSSLFTCDCAQTVLRTLNWQRGSYIILDNVSIMGHGPSVRAD